MKHDALLASPFFAHMSPDELDEIIGFASERRVAKGAEIFGRGDPGTSVMAVLAGSVRVFTVSRDEGREVTLNVIKAGEIFGEIALLDGKPRSASAVAQEDCVLMVIERRQFLPFLLQNQALMERMLVVLCDRVRRTSLALEELALYELPERLARLLLALAQDHGRAVPEGVRIDLKLSQRDLATRVASSRETVNKQLAAWRTKGVLDLVERYVVVKDKAALEKLVT